MERPPTVTVRLGNTIHVSLPNIKAYTQYLMEFRIDQEVAHHLSKRYSAMRSIHERLFESFEGIRLPSFPRKHIFDSNGASTVSSRGRELVDYFNAIMAIPELLVSDKFHSIMEMGTTASEHFKIVGEYCLEWTRFQKREQLRESDPAALDRYQQYQEESQKFHLGATKPEEPLIFTISEDISFTYRPGRQRAVIVGPNFKEWFYIDKIDPSLQNKCHFVLKNPQGQPLIFMQEKLSHMTRKFIIYRCLRELTRGETQVDEMMHELATRTLALSSNIDADDVIHRPIIDPLGPPEYDLLRLCSVTRIANIPAEYEVTMGGKHVFSRSKQDVKLVGNMAQDAYEFTKRTEGISICRFNRISSLYYIRIMANQDILIQLAMAAAVQKMANDPPAWC